MKKKWYSGKVYLITGATGAIGTEVCKRFAPFGLRMYLLDLPNPDSTDLINELKKLGAEYAEFIECDITNEEQIKAAISIITEKEEYIDILHNNAGIGDRFSIESENSFERYREIMAVNVDGIWKMLQVASPYIGRPVPTDEYPEQREGQLIFTSSSAGKTGIPYLAAYSMSKHALNALADSLRMEYKMENHDIKVITACPAPANTKFWKSSSDLGVWSEKYQKRGFLYQYVTAEDIAKRIIKASKKDKKEIFVPRWWKLLEIFKVFSHRFIERMLIKIEKSKKKKE